MTFPRSNVLSARVSSLELITIRIYEKVIGISSEKFVVFELKNEKIKRCIF